MKEFGQNALKDQKIEANNSQMFRVERVAEAKIRTREHERIRGEVPDEPKS